MYVEIPHLFLFLRLFFFFISYTRRKILPGNTNLPVFKHPENYSLVLIRDRVITILDQLSKRKSQFRNYPHCVHPLSLCTHTFQSVSRDQKSSDRTEI